MRERMSAQYVGYMGQKMNEGVLENLSERKFFPVTSKHQYFFCAKLLSERPRVFRLFRLETDTGV